jgi:hypothetical protein
MSGDRLLRRHGLGVRGSQLDIHLHRYRQHPPARSDRLIDYVAEKLTAGQLASAVTRLTYQVLQGNGSDPWGEHDINRRASSGQCKPWRGAG